LFFVPKSSAKTDEIAKEEAALLALLHMTPTLPHDVNYQSHTRQCGFELWKRPNKQRSSNAGTAAKDGKALSDNRSNNTNKGKPKSGTSSSLSLDEPLAMAGSFCICRTTTTTCKMPNDENAMLAFDDTKQYDWPIEIIPYSCRPSVGHKLKVSCAVIPI
jgi:hypothetical protein